MEIDLGAIFREVVGMLEEELKKDEHSPQIVQLAKMNLDYLNHIKGGASTADEDDVSWDFSLLRK